MSKNKYETMYKMLLKEKQSLFGKDEIEAKQVSTELPEDFNQNGWEQVVDAIELLLESTLELIEVKDDLLTQPHLKIVYNRCMIATNKNYEIIAKQKAKIDEVTDYEEAFFKLSDELKQLKAEMEQPE